MGTCYIVGAGEFYGSFAPQDCDLVIAADGGYAELRRRGISCDLLVGDMDSLDTPPTELEIIRHPVEKDETDMHLAYLEGKRRGYTHFAIYGGVGGRADHTFANYCLLSYIRGDGCRAVMYDKQSKAYVIKNEVTRVVGESGKGISIFAFGGLASGVTIRGLYYELSDGTLTPSFPIGVSNHFLDKPAEIEVTDGELLIIEEL